MSRRLTQTTAACGVALALAAPAFAAGPGPAVEEPVVARVGPAAPAPAPVIATDWSGPYIGAQLGWGRAGADGLEADGDGLIGGVTGGYRFDFGTVVLGAEAQYDWTEIDLDDVEVDGDEVDGDVGALDNIGRLKATAGFDAGRTLVYGSAGWAHASAEIDGEDHDDGGWLLGAGLDHLITDRVTVGGEIMHHRFDEFDDSEIDVDATTLQARVTFRF